jgi:hypothetical protein
MNEILRSLLTVEDYIKIDVTPSATYNTWEYIPISEIKNGYVYFYYNQRLRWGNLSDVQFDENNTALLINNNWWDVSGGLFK